ncbi:hypothetical protein Tco_1372184, partial [Tanacetum coccineum]
MKATIAWRCRACDDFEPEDVIGVEDIVESEDEIVLLVFM